MEYKLFYLTPEGEDVSTCGKTVETACKTLDQILTIYYNTTDTPSVGLEIITSKSLITINKQLVVCNSRAYESLQLCFQIMT